MRSHDQAAFPGRLFIVEGIDGSGKSTQFSLLQKWLESEGYGTYFSEWNSSPLVRNVTRRGKWFENNGHAVLDTGTARSVLAGKGLKAATNGNALGRIAMSLFYATDFADRLEKEIMPALRGGFVVLTDRYVYSLMARAIVRGADPRWIRGVYEFALKPDIVIYLRADVDQLVRRVVQTAGFNYWESGMDLNLGDDIYDSFCEYQGRLLGVFDSMSREYGFHVVETAAQIQDGYDRIRNRLAPLLMSA